jgi:hypothetical protein
MKKEKKQGHLKFEYRFVGLQVRQVLILLKCRNETVYFLDTIEHRTEWNKKERMSAVVKDFVDMTIDSTESSDTHHQSPLSLQLVDALLCLFCP